MAKTQKHTAICSFQEGETKVAKGDLVELTPAQIPEYIQLGRIADPAKKAKRDTAA